MASLTTIVSRYQVCSYISLWYLRLWSHVDSSWSKQRRDTFSECLEAIYGESHECCSDSLTF